MVHKINAHLFKPAEALMSRLSFSKKFTLLGSITLVAVSVALLSLYIHMGETISSSQKELKGIALIQPLTKTIQSFQQHRGLSSGVLSGITDLSANRIAKEKIAVEAFKTLEVSLPEEIRQLDSWKNITAEWSNIRASGMQWSQSKNFNAHTQLINDVLLLTSRIADESGLTADSSLDTFYLTYTSTNELLNAMEHLGQLRAYGTAVLGAKHISEQQKSDLVSLMTLLKHTLNPLKINMDKVAHYNPSLQSVLSETYSNINNASQKVIKEVNTDILSERFSMSPADYFEFTTAAINNGYAQLHQSLLPTAESLIQARIQRANSALNATITFASILLLLLIYFLSAIHRTTIVNIKTLTKSVLGFIRGDMLGRIHLNTHDEFATIGDGFNTMADELTELISTKQSALDLVMKIAHSVPGVVYQFRQRVDGSSCFPFASEGIREIYRVNPEEVREDATKAFLCIHPVDLEKVVESIQTSAQNLTQWHHEYRVKFDDGTVKWLLGNAMPEREADGATLWHGFITDITARKQLEEEVRQLAFYDTLTKLPNRRLLNDRLSQTIAASKRTGSYGALMFLDLDNFKPLNDTHGHEVGDMLLIEAANRLTHCIREMDTVARFGGDEFVVMLGELDEDKSVSTAQAAVVAEKIRATLSEPYQFTVSHDGQADATVEHLCTGSIGVVVFNGSEGSQDDLMKWADAAMYEAKNTGRNQIRFYGE